MARDIWRRISWPVVIVGLSGPFMVNCGIMQEWSKMPTNPLVPTCPDMSKIDDVEKFDFATSFKLNPVVGVKVKRGVGAALEMKALADRIDHDLLKACGGIAHDLGDTATYPGGQEACEAVVKEIGDIKAKLGAHAAVKLDVSEPRCSVDLKAYSDCAAQCDPTFKPGVAEMQCDGDLQGTCSGDCSGVCQVEAGAACSGDCSGTCDAKITGRCDDACTGTCDGKAMPASGGKCAGECVGTCSGHMKGTCSGKCGGRCHMTGAAPCSGTCTGGCSVKMDALRCSGAAKPPTISGDCKAKCDARAQADVSCTDPRVQVDVTGAADAQEADRLRKAIENNLPRVVDVGEGMAKNVAQLGGDIIPVLQGGQGVVQAALANKVYGGALVACVTEPFASAILAVAHVEASVKVSVNVQASASSSASGGASGG